MSSSEFADAAFDALRHTEAGWQFSNAGLARLEEKLDASILEGTFDDSAAELGALFGFFKKREDAGPALAQLTTLSTKFEADLRTFQSRRRERRRQKAERASHMLGVRAPQTMKRHDTPHPGISLTKLVPPELLLDPRTFRFKKSRSSTPVAPARLPSPPMNRGRVLRISDSHTETRVGHKVRWTLSN